MKDKCRRIELLILDCDGVLGDGKITYTENNLESKTFSALDGLGLSLWHCAGMKSAVITGRKSKALIRRCEDLKIDYLYQGVKDKIPVAEKIMTDLSLKWENVAFMGDDWNDYPLFEMVGLAATPNQSFPQIKKKVHYIASRDGGNGAVREFIEYILQTNGLFELAVEKFINGLQA